MKSCAEKVRVLLKLEGREGVWEAQCDLSYSPDGRPVAIFDWGSDMELLGGRYAPLRPELLRPSTTPGIRFDYLNQNEPILVPRDLANQPHPEPLSQEAFRLGYLLLKLYHQDSAGHLTD
jgi:hypothetical protein